MTDWVVSLGQAAKQFQQLEGDMKAAAFRGLVAAAARGVQCIVVEIIPKRIPQPVDRGLYRAGWKVRVGPNYAEIYNDEPVAPIIEDGVRASNVKPGKAMIEALASWAMRKGFASDAKQAKGMAFAIAANMQKRGIFNRDGKSGLGILRELVTWKLDSLIETEVLRALGKI